MCLLGLAVLPLHLLAFSYSTGEVYLGQWNSGYTKGRQYAEEHHLPMLLLWARKSCSMCNAMKAAMDGADFKEWMSTHRIVLSVSHDGDADSGAALSFVRTNNRALNDLPLMCIYWPKPDGTTVLRSFVGRERSMPVKTGNLAMQLAASVESVLETAGFDFASMQDAPMAPTPIVVPEPSFALKYATVNEVQFLPVVQSFKLAHVSNGAITIKKVSGKLPAGLKMFYDASSASVVLRGTSSKAGTFTSGWTVSERLASGTVAGKQVFTMTVNVAALAKEIPVFAAKTLKTTGIVLSEDGELEGVITLSLSQKGQSSVLFEDGVTKVKGSSKAWVGFATDGLLELDGTGSGCAYRIGVSQAGFLRGIWKGPNRVEREILFSEPLWSAVTPAQSFIMNQKIMFSEGAGELQLTMNKTNAKKGTMSFKGMFPNRFRISGKGVLIGQEEGEAALLPVLKKSGKNVVRGLLQLRAGSQGVKGSISYAQNGDWRTISIQ